MTPMNRKEPVKVIGAGLAGSEAAWQIASRGIEVLLVEQRPGKMTPAHKTGKFAELVCSNSLGSNDESSPAGILKEELRSCRSLVMECADRTMVPAGRALAVDREGFAECVTEKLKSHPNIRIEQREITDLPQEPAIIATGPLTSESLADMIREKTGGEFLYFYDAVSPVLELDSVDMERAFWGSRYEDGKDYLNCPMNREEYEVFWKELVNAEQAPRHEFEKKVPYFEACLPVEVIASRGIDTLRFGPLKPVGLTDPRTGERPWAVVQLRRDNREGTLYNIVGFQTNLRWSEQDRVFRLIPALAEAEFVRYGVMHRNVYVNAPSVLDSRLRIRESGNIFLAGQITGVEGYMESTAMGLVAALNLFALYRGLDFPGWPRETAIGSLLNYLSDAEVKTFRPMNANLGILPRLPEKIRDKRERCRRVASVARRAMSEFSGSRPDVFSV